MIPTIPLNAIAHTILTTAVLAQAAIALAVVLRAWAEPGEKISR